MEELLKNKLGLQVLTDTGWSNFKGLLDKGLQKTLKVRTETKEITCTPDHNFFDIKFCLLRFNIISIRTSISSKRLNTLKPTISPNSRRFQQGKRPDPF